MEPILVTYVTHTYRRWFSQGDRMPAEETVRLPPDLARDLSNIEQPPGVARTVVWQRWEATALIDGQSVPLYSDKQILKQL